MKRPAGMYLRSYRKDTAIVQTPLQVGLLIAFLALLFALPLFVGTEYLAIINIIGITIITVTGLNILTGYTGQFSLGQVAFVAVGAYTTAILSDRIGLPFWLCIPLAGVVSGLIGLIFALPSLRLKGFYLAMATLSAHFLIIWTIVHMSALTKGVYPYPLSRATLGPLVIAGEKSWFVVIMVVVIIMTIFAKNIARGRIGRAFVSIRDNYLAAESIGINVYRYKLLAFFICAFYAGVAGSLYAQYTQSVNSDAFPLMDSIWYIGMLIVGGMGTVLGGILGTVFLMGLRQAVAITASALGSLVPGVSGQLGAGLGFLVFAVAIITFLLFQPLGMAHKWEDFKAYYRVWPFSY